MLLIVVLIINSINNIKNVRTCPLIDILLSWIRASECGTGEETGETGEDTSEDTGEETAEDTAEDTGEETAETDEDTAETGEDTGEHTGEETAETGECVPVGSAWPALLSCARSPLSPSACISLCRQKTDVQSFPVGHQEVYVVTQV